MSAKKVSKLLLSRSFDFPVLTFERPYFPECINIQESIFTNTIYRDNPGKWTVAKPYHFLFAAQ